MKLKILSSFAIFSLIPFTLNAATTTSEQVIRDLNLLELANTYSESEIAKIIPSQDRTRFDAVLIDIGIITVRDLQDKIYLSSKLNLFLSDHLNLSENYIGNVSDKNIAERIRKKWENSTVIDDEDVINKLNSLIDKGFTTGYNITNINCKSNFNNDLMIRYGHNNIDHATQLIYLMRSHGFDPKIQLIPKLSAFLYLPEWGEPTAPTIKTNTGKVIAFVKEYNLDFEFQTQSTKRRFMGLIDRYAKKDKADEEGLLIESWWQPFYRTYTKTDNYKVLSENRMIIGQYQAELMSLPEKTKDLKENINSTLNHTMVPVKTWVNPSFYRYMNGGFK
ncbi:hypothetical protein ACIMS1_004498 [Vibrio harveyi]